MRRFARLVILVFAAGTLVVTGCDDSDDEATDEAEQEMGAEEDDGAEHAEPEFDEDMFILAAYEARCVEQQIEDEDEVADIRDEVYARYGFTEDSFEEASGHFDGQEPVELQIETRMEQCDEERARGFAQEGAGELDEEAEGQESEEAEESEETEEADDGDTETAEARPQPDPEPAVTGSFQTRLDGAEFEDTELELNIRPNFDVGGELRGQRGDSDFLIPITGEISDDDTLQARGERGAHNVEIDGDLHSRGVEGELSGEIDGSSYRLRYDVR